MLDYHESEREAYPNSCEERLECQDEIGVPVQKNSSQSHFSADHEDDSVWREVTFVCL
jgi:hypothetical protein